MTPRQANSRATVRTGGSGWAGRVAGRWRGVLAAAVVLAAAGGPALAAGTGTGQPANAGPVWGALTSRASESSAGGQANAMSGLFGLGISRSGRYVAFWSEASNLVAGDTNGVADVFVRDRLAGITERVSVGPSGRQADGESRYPAISASGRYVAFASRASNLVTGDTNAVADVYVRDVVAGVTRRVSVGPGGRQADGDSFRPALSASGRQVVFDSLSTNLTAGDTNAASDVFVRDVEAGVTERVSVGPGRRQGDGVSFVAAISASGRHVAFQSSASNLVPGDTNAREDVFLRDRLSDVTRRVSVGAGGRQANGDSAGGALSADGRFVAFISIATNLVPPDRNQTFDVFVRDRQTRITERITVLPDGRGACCFSNRPTLSADGRYVAFESVADLVAGDTNGVPDAFVRDRATGVTRRVSVGPGGVQSDGPSDFPEISADGRHVAFRSAASNLVEADTNHLEDVFVRDRFGDAQAGGDGLQVRVR